MDDAEKRGVTGMRVKNAAPMPLSSIAPDYEDAAFRDIIGIAENAEGSASVSLRV